MTNKAFEIGKDVMLGGDKPVLIAGPCAVESEDIIFHTAEKLIEIARNTGFPLVFKASFDKANRTSHTSFRSIGYEKALGILSNVKKEFDIPVLTDIHEADQVAEVSKIVDILQIPAFLCRQTTLLQEAGKSGLPVNIKKGQFMAPGDMKYAAEKVTAVGNEKVFLTERGVTFGYHNLVVDFRALPIMRAFAPVIFDVTHSIQMPGGAGGSSGGQKEFAPYLARAAAAVEVDGFFIETHPEPEKALSDGPNMIKLDRMEPFLSALHAIWSIRNGS